MASSEVATFTVQDTQHGDSLVQFLARELSLSKNKTKALIDSKQVFVNKQRIWMASHLLSAGDVIECKLPQSDSPTPTQLQVKILLEDKDLLILDKPAGLLSNGERSFESLVRSALGNKDLTAAHRLDQYTSGAIIFAKNEQVFEKLKVLFAAKKINKEYLALAKGKLAFKRTTIDKKLDSKTAVSHFTVIDSCDLATLLAVTIETGRTHQIRRHLAALHSALIGDGSYGESFESSEVLRSAPRQLLHAQKIEFVYEGRKLAGAAPLPEDFARMLRSLGLTVP